MASPGTRRITHMGGSTGMRHIDGSLLAIVVEFHLERECLANARRAGAPGKRGGVDEDVLPSLSG